MNWITLLRLFFIFFFSSCLYLQNQSLGNIHYPETPFFSGFLPGQSEVNKEYSLIWCKKFCPQIKAILENYSEEYFLEIRGKFDATELPINRERLSLGRAESIQQLLLTHGIPENKMKAIADPEPDKYLGRDKFDPENRTVRFRIRKKE